MLPFAHRSINALTALIAVQTAVLYFLIHHQKTGVRNTNIGLSYVEKTAEHIDTIKAKQNISVAIGLAVTTKGAKPTNASELGINCLFLTSLLPSFCQTASKGYDYRFYLAYDKNDVYMTRDSFRRTFCATFRALAESHCPHNSSYSIHLVKCNHSGYPAWAQNDAMIQAYMDDTDYYYRLNDDSVMLTPKWTEIFIRNLSSFDPPNVGVVGPLHKGGNRHILAFDFVHKTHIDIFGFYYPRKFPTWHADHWITDVYKPKRSKKLASVQVVHTMAAGRRYFPTYMGNSAISHAIQQDITRLEK